MTKLTTDQEKIQFENMKKEVITLLEKFAKDNYYKFNRDSGYIDVDYYFDYKEVDYLQNHVKRLIKRGVTDRDELRYTLLDILHENEFYGDSITGLVQDEFLNAYHDELEKIINSWNELVEFDLFLELDIYVSYVYDIDDIINDTQLDILVFLENENAFDQEFGNNNFMDMLRYSKTKEDYHEYLEDSSVKMLLDSQGYTSDHLIDYLWYEEEEFNDDLNQLQSDPTFTSIVEEIENAQNYQSLVMLTQMTAKEYFLVTELDSYLISKNSVVGYLGVIDGSGSILNIQLNNDIQLEKDQFKIKVDGAIGYSVAEIYGIDFSDL